ADVERVVAPAVLEKTCQVRLCLISEAGKAAAHGEAPVRLDGDGAHEPLAGRERRVVRAVRVQPVESRRGRTCDRNRSADENPAVTLQRDNGDAALDVRVEAVIE